MFESGSGSDQDLNPMQLWFQKVQSYSDKNSASDKNTVNWLTYNSEMVKDIYKFKVQGTFSKKKFGKMCS